MGENNDEDAEKFAILYFLHSFVLSNIDTVVIPHLHFDLGMPLAIQVWLYECCSNVPPKIALKAENRILRLLNWKTIAPRPRYEFLMNAMFKDNDKVVFKNIEPTEMEMAKLEIPKKDVTEDERSVDSKDDFQDPPPKKINERSKKKQKVDSSTPVQSKADSHVEEVAASKRESHVEKEKFISKKVFDAFREEVRQEFKGVREEFTRVRQLVKKKLKKMVKAIEHSKIIDEKLDDTNLSDSQFTIPDELLPSLNAYLKVSTTRHPLTTLEEEQIDEYFNDKKFEFVVQEHCQDETVLPDSQDTIPDDLLPTLNVYSSKSIIVHPSANREIQTPISRLRIRRPSKFKESPYTMKFGSAAESSKGHIRIFPQKHPFVYHPIDGIVDTKIVNKLGIGFLKTFSMFMLKANAENLMAGGHMTHVYEYINKFCMHAAVPWHTVEDIYISVNIKEKYHWVLAILYFSERCIFLYGSYESSGHYSAVLDVIEKLAVIIPLCLEHCDFYVKKGIYVENHPRYKDKDSSDMFDVLFQENFPQQLSRIFGHYEVVLAEIEKIAKIIPLCLQACDFYVKKEIDHQSHPRYKDKESSDMFDVLFQDDLPQQPSGSLDCGVFMVMYAECVSYGHKVIASEFDPNAFRTRYAALLWDYGIQKQEANTISDVEAPVRPARQSRITSVTEVVDV
ncbi:hypothetical protein T459_01595 [Capsicum annuum]|uniref:Ubiquitin-like protease family profile domain-containing protein n=1 Tax=Capsicum annuum TaxID=4072 RepID=A0A2G3AHS3_CAPAN|nr:hypothetical protein T459_01595 [Capsicum annuum]